tara:strand:+ start:1243 stop:1500 length:258 start_codon:yes stop_codon:yes gene_type:complete
MDLLKLEEDISERLMIELGDELRTEYLTFATTFVMEEIKKHLEVKNNGVLDDVMVCEDCNNIGEESKKLGKVLCDNCFDIAISKL